MREVTVRTEPRTLNDIKQPWEKPETVILALEDVEKAADIDIVFASSCCKTCDVD